MLNGENPAGKFGSTKDIETLAKFLSHTSILPDLKLAAYNRFCPAFTARLKPVYEEVATLFFINNALFPACGFQPERIPSTPTKMNLAGWPLTNTKSADPLNTTPVGLPPTGPPGEGIKTGGRTIFPS